MWKHLAFINEISGVQPYYFYVNGIVSCGYSGDPARNIPVQPDFASRTLPNSVHTKSPNSACSGHPHGYQTDLPMAGADPIAWAGWAATHGVLAPGSSPNGRLDDIRFYNRSLSTAEIADIYDATRHDPQ